MTEQERNAARYEYILLCEDESVCALIADTMFSDIGSLSALIDELIEEAKI